MQTFKIKYFDGQTSAKHEGELRLSYAHWDIRINNPDGTNYSVLWHLKDIKQTEFVGSTNIFKYGDFPQQTLECNEPTFVEAIHEIYPHNEFFKKEYLWALNKGIGVFVGILVVLGLCAFGFYKFALPPIAERLASTVPLAWEIKLGDSMLNNMMQNQAKNTKDSISFSMNLTKNDSLSILANQFVKQIDFKTHYPLHITVVDEDVVNAFALPGGNIVVYNGLLKKMKTPEEFAALLGHEAAHVSHRHSLKGIFKNMAGYLFISLITSDLNGVSAIAIENANMLNNLSYSRVLEAEADNNAMTMLKSNQIPTKGLLDLFKILEKIDHGKMPEMLNSHPLTEDRIKFAKKNMVNHEQKLSKPLMTQIWSRIQNIEGKIKK